MIAPSLFSNEQFESMDREIRYVRACSRIGVDIFVQRMARVTHTTLFVIEMLKKRLS